MKTAKVVLMIPFEPGEMTAADCESLRAQVRAFTRVRLLEMGGKLLEPPETKGRKAR